MLKHLLKRKAWLACLAAMLSVAMVFPAMASTTSIDSVSLNLTYWIREGDTSTNVRVTANSGKYEVDEVDVTNEPSDGWEEGDKPKIKVTLTTDTDDYKFSSMSKSDVTLNGSEGTVTSVSKKSNSTLYVYITLAEVEEDSSGSGIQPNNMPNHQAGGQQPGNRQPGGQQPGNQQPGNQQMNQTDGHNNGGNAGWSKDDKGWRYRDDGNNTVKKQWKSIGNKWYFFDDNGYMKTGWFQNNGKWYYCNNDGERKTGWIQDGDKWYYCDENGEMLTDTTTPDGYRVGPDGAWMR